eukprot:3006554-Amphidinium_carterae.1
MARAGVPPWRIQLFGRWESSVVQRYIRDAGAELSGDIAAMVCGSPVVRLTEIAAEWPDARDKSVQEIKTV